MGAPYLQHHLDALRASLAQEIQVLCDQLNLSFQAHVSDMASSVGRLLIVDMELLLVENTKLRKAALRDNNLADTRLGERQEEDHGGPRKESAQTKSALSDAEESAQTKSALSDAEDANIPAEMEMINQDAPCFHVNTANPVCFTGSSGSSPGLQAKEGEDCEATDLERQAESERDRDNARDGQGFTCSGPGGSGELGQVNLDTQDVNEPVESGEVHLAYDVVSDVLAVETDQHGALLEDSAMDTIPPATVTTDFQPNPETGSRPSGFELSTRPKRHSEYSSSSFESSIVTGSAAPSEPQMRTSRTSETSRISRSDINFWFHAGSMLNFTASRISQFSNPRSSQTSARTQASTRTTKSQEGFKLVTVWESMKKLKTNNPASGIDLLPQWEDMVCSTLQNDQVDQAEHRESSHSSRGSHAEAQFQWPKKNTTTSNLAWALRAVAASVIYRGRTSHNSSVSQASATCPCNGWRHPASSERFCWEGLSVLMVLSDLLVVPLAAFEIFESPLGMLTFIFWNIDIMFSMLTGYEVRSRIEMRLRQTAWHYMRTWFVLDMLVLAPEWIWIFFGRDGRVARFGNLTLVLRVLKVSRLLRILRLARAWTGIRSRLRHHDVLVLLQFLKLCSIVLFFNHYSACAWYGIGTIQGDDGWVSRLGLQSSPLAYKYLTSLHWAMAQFHSSMEIHAATSWERLFSLACQFVGMVASSLFISSVTSLAMRAQKLRQDKFLYKYAVMRYLEENRISTKLTMQMNTFMSRTADANSNKTDMAELLKIFPRHLRVELAIELRTPVIQSNFISKLIVKLLPRVTKEVCVHVVKEVHEKPGRLIFEYMEASRKAFIVWKGQALYSTKDEKGEDGEVEFECQPTFSMTMTKTLSSAVGKIRSAGRARQLAEGNFSSKGTETVEAGTCIAEMNLFTSWQHRGDCMLMGSATGFAIDAEDLKSFLMDPENQDFRLAQLLAKHALDYIQWLRLVPSNDVNDLYQFPAGG